MSTETTFGNTFLQVSYDGGQCQIRILSMQHKKDKIKHVPPDNLLQLLWDLSRDWSEMDHILLINWEIC